MWIQLGLRGVQQKCAHNAYEISALHPELGLPQIYGYPWILLCRYRFLVLLNLQAGTYRLIEMSRARSRVFATS